jgi:MFS family permease
LTEAPPPQSETIPHPLVGGHAVSELTRAQRRRGLIAVMASLMAAGLTYGTSIPLLSLLLERAGVSMTLIGLNSATTLLATVVLSPFIPSLVAKFGTMRCLISGVVLVVAGFLLLPLFRSLEAWFVLRFLIGLGVTVHWVVSETWLNAITTKANRGLYAGLYATLMGLGFAGGPALLTVTDLDGWLPFLVIVASICLATAPLLWAAESAPAMEMSLPSERWSAFRVAPTIFIAVFASGMAESSLMSLMPIFGMRSGVPQDQAVLMLTVAISGAVCLQVPIGWLTDRINRRALLILSGAIGFLGAAALPYIVEPAYLRLPVLFLWGGFVMGIYTIGLAELGDRFGKGALGGANALYVMSYCLGSLAGPPLSGSAIDILGAPGFPAALAAVYAVFLVIGVGRSLSRIRQRKG